MNIYNDKPIETQKEDLLDREYFVDRFVNLMKNYNSKESFTIGLYGKWGVGKTSIINLVSEKLKQENKINKDDKYKIFYFNPWFFKDDESLINHFFDELYKELNIVDYDKIIETLGDFFISIGNLLRFGMFMPVVSPYVSVIAPLIKEYGKALKSNSKKSLLDIKNEISAKMNKLDKKLIIFIDDIDRLKDNEICSIFQLVKLIGDFNNVIYVLSMDKEVVVSALENSQKGHAEEYLEKIIQYPIQITDTGYSNIQEYAKCEINKIIYKENISEEQNFEIIRLGFWSEFNTIRDVKRFINIFSLRYYAYNGNINILDLLLMTMYELKYGEVRTWINENKKDLLGLLDRFNDENEKNKVKEKLNNILLKIKERYGEQKSKYIKNTLIFLFPKIQSVLSSGWEQIAKNMQELEIEGKVCTDFNFYKYYDFGRTEYGLTNKEIKDLMFTNDGNEIMTALNKVNAKCQIDKILEVLSSYLDEIDASRVDILINSLIKISGEIKEKEDISIFALPNSRVIAYLILKLLNKNKGKVIENIKNIISNNINLTTIYMVEILLEYNKNSSEINIENRCLILRSEEIDSIKSIVKDKLVDFVSNEKNFKVFGYQRGYYLLKKIDPELCDKVVKENVNSTNVYDFILNFYARSQNMTNGKMSYFYGEGIKEIVDIEMAYNSIKERVAQEKGMNNYDYRAVIFLICYENGFQHDVAFTKDDVVDYVEKMTI